ncbi:23S rRNA (adenine(1618)-N(6))-methyltransferase RlmF [Horticoccus luteus]|uniref:23S rRNA (Adenine(1618)-N(6))-methyltransferase RlmF n=1 Tax=Horticoccus luteus TaxID=2862869 RepID=A0A8F9TV15_9BACT|nr:23S rRNA (adenine(1618)-N(6))-methyltransferase RlmF [Horticoccus luteus]QYM79636.1 23S rRNA (adenine(1618)-N(6))-methyltransferase RlmF [Horticoccus luteus]
MSSSSSLSSAKPGLHPRNRHAAGYDFAALLRTCPDLAPFVRPSPVGTATIDFADPTAVVALNRALLRHHYGIAHWEIPPGYLCPPVPGRADYLHHVADLLATDHANAIPRGSSVRVLDLGVGANCIYPLLGVCDYGWHFVGTEIDPAALASARRIVAANPALHGAIELRLQRSSAQLFAGVVAPGETFAVSLCNPPFHASAAEAAAGTTRKLRHLHGTARRTAPALNFGGRPHELWCDGGEPAFIRRLILQSAAHPHLCGWFTTLVSRAENLPAIARLLADVKAADARVIPMAQGQKKSRLVAWRFR